MSTHYNKIDSCTDSETSQQNSLVTSLLNKFSDLGKKNGHVLQSDRLDIITNSSSSSFQDRESLFLREQLWYKNKIILLSLASVIVVILILIALFAFEPWK
ncbi:hypothetical protein BpHYR1_023456 [Brachionus plicatilis]|uniref:Uncharacterized protein n=1 Tax=Brachionus plicatilis TaxID=10195 RepID=A0A3M7RDI7_BRAPC|nr:hypothetical protein BpHYR1_023456 [Brachionus plicatilis]